MSSADLQNCKICFAPGASVHYGGMSCCGCRTFFRRAVRRQRLLKCKTEAGNCDLSNRKRRNCQKCRMQKCLDAGMNTEDVQKDRDPISSGYQKLESEEIVSNSCVVTLPINATKLTTTWRSTHDHNCNMYKESWGVGRYMGPATNVSVICKPMTSGNNFHAIVELAISFDYNARRSEKTGVRNYWSRRGKDFSKNIADADASLLRDLSELQQSDMMELLGITSRALIDSAKEDSDFCSLPLRDQIALIRSNIYTAEIMDGFRRSRNFDDIFVFHDELHVLRYRDCEGKSSFDMKHFLDSMNAFRCVDLGAIEFALLKSIAFWNANSCSAASKTVVRDKQNQFMVALEEYLSRKQAVAEGNYGRLLLLLLYCEKFSLVARNNSRLFFQNPDPLIREVYIREVDDG